MHEWITQGILAESTVDLINLGCFEKKVNNIFNMKRGCSKLVSTRRSILAESTVDLINLGCFEKKVNNIFNMKRGCSKLVSTRRSTVLSLLG